MTLTSDASLILCAGIPRSGSTWLYNAARMLASHPARGDHPVYGAWIEHYDPSNPARVHVVKVHEPDEKLAWRASAVLTSRRDLRTLRRLWIDR